MLRRVTVTCPKCKLVCHLYLGTDAPMVIIRCPSCTTSLMSYAGRAIVLSEPEMDALKRGDCADLVTRCLSRSEPRSLEREQGRDNNPVVPAQAPMAHPLESESRGTRRVSHDDVVDIYRELETCGDCAEFIGRL